jgi:hypothetical protein
MSVASSGWETEMAATWTKSPVVAAAAGGAVAAGTTGWAEVVEVGFTRTMGAAAVSVVEVAGCVADEGVVAADVVAAVVLDVSATG